MKVRELAQKLREFDGDAEIRVGSMSRIDGVLTYVGLGETSVEDVLLMRDIDIGADFVILATRSDFPEFVE